MNDAETDVERLRKVADSLMEHFDAVQVFATRHDTAIDATVSVNWGRGNWHARRNLVRLWGERQDEQDREEVRRDE